MNPAAIVVKVVHECTKVRRTAYAVLQRASGRQLSAVSIRSEVECISATDLGELVDPTPRPILAHLEPSGDASISELAKPSRDPAAGGDEAFRCAG